MELEFSPPLLAWDGRTDRPMDSRAQSELSARSSARKGVCARWCETWTEIRAIVRWYDGYEDLSSIKCLLAVVVGEEHAGCEYAMMDS